MSENEEVVEEQKFEANEDGLIVPTGKIEAGLADIRKTLGLNEKGEETPAEEPVVNPDGSQVDWSDYDLDPRFAHLYPQSKLYMTEQGPQFCVMADDFLALRAPYDILGRQIAQMVNGPEGWRLISTIVPAGAITRKQAKLAGHPLVWGPCGLVTLQRKMPLVLPTPNLLKTEADDAVAEPMSEELKTVEDAALGWMEKEGVKTVEEDEPVWETAETQAPVPAALAAAEEFVKAKEDAAE